MKNSNLILFFDRISISDITKVGGKNASLGEMYNQLNSKGVGIPNGFVLTADAYRLFRRQNDIDQQLNDLQWFFRLMHFSHFQHKGLIKETIRVAKRNNIKVGLCGQAPSDISAFAKFLVGGY